MDKNHENNRYMDDNYENNRYMANDIPEILKDDIPYIRSNADGSSDNDGTSFDFDAMIEAADLAITMKEIFVVLCKPKGTQEVVTKSSMAGPTVQLYVLLKAIEKLAVETADELGISHDLLPGILTTLVNSMVFDERDGDGPDDPETEAHNGSPDTQ